MIYGILFFFTALAVIIMSRITVAKVEGASSKFVKNRWIWGIASMASLTSGVLLSVEWFIGKAILIVFAAFAAMVFFELNRRFINRRYVELSEISSSQRLSKKAA